MCGLVGFYSTTAATDSELQLFKNLLLVDQIRGMHATGVAKVKIKENTAVIHKKALDAVDFLALDETKDFLTKDRGNIYIGHNRYATMGNKADHDNAHPFQQDHITLVHNGSVDSWGLDKLEGVDDIDVKVDSHMVCKTIAKHGIKKAVEEHLSGAFALVWWDTNERSLNFIRNGDRPLYLGITTSGCLVWASEKGMLDVFLDREGKHSSYRMKPEMIQTNAHYKFTFNEMGNRVGTQPTVTAMEFLELPSPKPQANHWDPDDWYGSSNHTSLRPVSQGSSSANGVNSSATTEDANRARINLMLKQRGLPFQYGSIVTCDVVSFIPYETNPAFGRVRVKERASGHLCEFWGLSMDQVKPIKVLRGEVHNCYDAIMNGNQSFNIHLERAHVSCHDDRYDGRNNFPLARMSTSSTTTSPSSDEIAKKYDVKLKTVHYPLKVHGHTFRTNVEFTDFVCQGCNLCGKVPTPYDRRNHDMTVVEGRAFQGLLEDCEFTCGECVGEQ